MCCNCLVYSRVRIGENFLHGFLVNSFFLFPFYQSWGCTPPIPFLLLNHKIRNGPCLSTRRNLHASSKFWKNYTTPNESSCQGLSKLYFFFKHLNCFKNYLFGKPPFFDTMLLPITSNRWINYLLAITRIITAWLR